MPEAAECSGKNNGPGAGVWGVRRLGEESGRGQENLSEEMTVALAPFALWVLPVKERKRRRLNYLKLPVPLICGSASTKQLCQQPLLETWSGESLGYLFKITWLAISKTMQALVKVQ